MCTVYANYTYVYCLYTYMYINVYYVWYKHMQKSMPLKEKLAKVLFGTTDS